MQVYVYVNVCIVHIDIYTHAIHIKTQRYDLLFFTNPEFIIIIGMLYNCPILPQYNEYLSRLSRRQDIHIQNIYIYICCVHIYVYSIAVVNNKKMSLIRLFTRIILSHHTYSKPSLNRSTMGLFRVGLKSQIIIPVNHLAPK